VLNFHGLTNSPFGQQNIAQMDTVADTAHYLIAYPQGLFVSEPIAGRLGRGWHYPGNTARSDQDDIDFVDSLVQHVRREFRIDTRRVHATGWSSGGIMSFYLACERPDLIASAAGVSGHFTDALMAECDPGRPYSSAIVHGTADDFVLYQGEQGLYPSVEMARLFWAEYNGCSPNPRVVDIPNTSPGDGSVQRIEHDGCNGGAELLVFKVNQGGHTWPGGFPLREALGTVNRDISASAEILAFFGRNPMPPPGTSSEHGLTRSVGPSSHRTTGFGTPTSVRIVPASVENR